MPDEWMILLFGESEADGKRTSRGRFIATARASFGWVSTLSWISVCGPRKSGPLLLAGIDGGAKCELVYLAIGEAEQRDRIDRRFAGHRS